MVVVVVMVNPSGSVTMRSTGEWAVAKIAGGRAEITYLKPRNPVKFFIKFFYLTSIPLSKSVALTTSYPPLSPTYIAT